LERDRFGSGASGAAAGMLGATAEVHFEEHYRLQLELESLRRYPQFVEELCADADTDVDYRREGTLIVGLDRDDDEALDRVYRFQKAAGLPVQRLEPAEVRAREPALAPTVAGATYCPADHQVDPRKMVVALQRACARHGAELREGCSVTAIRSGDAGVTGVTFSDGEELDGSNVVLAAGAWSRQIEGLPKAERPRVRPIRGQMVALRMPEPLCRHVIRAPDAYLVPKSDGRLLVGSTMEEVGFDTSLTAGGLFEILRGAWEAMPGVYDLDVIESWAGLRPVSFTNDPILRQTSIDGLWLATGHGRNGILLTPITAYAMAQAIEGEPSEWVTLRDR
jgi:glycine oxidase